MIWAEDKRIKNGTITIMWKTFFILIAILGLAACSISQQQLHAGQQQYENGHYRQSVGHIVNAAVRGNAQAQYVLGYMYYYGQGLPHDPDAAQYWIQKSAKQGYPQATMALYMFHQAKYKLPDTKTGQVTFSSIPIDITSPATDSSQSEDKKENANDLSQPENKKKNAKTKLKPKTYRKTDQACYCKTMSAVSPKAVHHHAAQKVIIPKPQLKKSKLNTIQILKRTSPNRYTIQLIALRNAEKLKAFIKNNHLENKAFTYCAQHHHKPLFIAIYGIYQNKSKAVAACRKLPPKLKKLQPWIKSFAAVHSQLH